ncbi:hypothetical protein E2C01_100621 [Portunus trituberculatus]|uniref:Uncharacterized protein n=1 Tax=Portunus trituberculatus TaxID=210409 RepID=A0A5B7KIE3_PORTR|nr:hypothetical protein [Portunus trituberculatus]
MHQTIYCRVKLFDPTNTHIYIIVVSYPSDNVTPDCLTTLIKVPLMGGIPLMKRRLAEARLKWCSHAVHMPLECRGDDDDDTAALLECVAPASRTPVRMEKCTR